MSEQRQLVLYRKYRPQSFTEVSGQDHVISVLKNALRLGRVAHGYLFSGSRGTGKTTVARLLAKAYNCQKPQADGEPCNRCQICEEFSQGRALDLIEIDAASNRGIDEIRELRESVRFSPAHAKRKVYIVDEVHMHTKEAFNALLKTLEEPPEQIMFILATTEPEKVPETVISRTQHFEFRRISQAKIMERMCLIAKKEKYQIDDDAVGTLTFLADGSLRDAESMLGQLMDAFPEGGSKDAMENLFSLPRLKLVHRLMDSALAGDSSRLMTTIGGLIQRGVDPRMLIKILMREAQILLISLINPAELENLKQELSEEHQEFFKNHASLSQKIVEYLLVKLIEVYQLGYRGPFPELPLELALLEVAASIQSKEEEKKR